MDIQIDRKTSILFLVVISVIILALATVLSSFLINKDYTALLRGECNPAQTSCFIEGEGDDEEVFTLLGYTAHSLEDCDPFFICPDAPECTFENECIQIVCTEDNIKMYAPETRCTI